MGQVGRRDRSLVFDEMGVTNLVGLMIGLALHCLLVCQ